MGVKCDNQTGGASGLIMSNLASIPPTGATIKKDQIDSQPIGNSKSSYCKSNKSHQSSQPHYYSIHNQHETGINEGLPPLENDQGPAISRYEFWPAWIFYVPVIMQCLWLGLRYRDLRLPLIANPGIELSGLVGESKHAILSLAGDKAQQWILPYIKVDQGEEEPARQLQGIYKNLSQQQLQFPLVAKPDIGCRGAGVRLIEHEQHLSDYVQQFPHKQSFLLQQKAPYSAEAGIFYTRHPGEERGQIISIALKYTPFVVGDGIKTLRELIEQDHRAGQVQHLYLPRHRLRLHEIIPAGKRFPLAFSGSHCRGSIFRNGNHLITNALTERLDDITNDIPGFYFGRLDIKFKDVASLSAGENLCIVEINGASSEAAHIWDRLTPLQEIFATLFKQYRMLYVFGHYHRQQGHKPPSVMSLLKAWRKEKSLVASYPSTD